jgi:hypothetical protein
MHDVTNPVSPPYIHPHICEQHHDPKHVRDNFAGTGTAAIPDYPHFTDRMLSTLTENIGTKRKF